MRGLYLEGHMYGGKFEFKNRLGYSLELEGYLPFLLFLLYIRGQLPSTRPRGGLELGGAIKRRFFCGTGSGGLYMEGLFSEFCGIL